MADIDGKDFIDEIMFCIKESDVVKAKALVQYFSGVESDIQMRTLYELSKSPDEVAFPILDYLREIKSSHGDVNEKIYDLLLETSHNNDKLVAEYITKNKGENRIVYIKIAGDLKLDMLRLLPGGIC